MAFLYENIFSTSPEKQITATKIPTQLERFYIQDPTNATEWTGLTVYVGTNVRIRAILEDYSRGYWGSISEERNVAIYHKLNDGAWENIGFVTCKPATPMGDLYYILDKAGTHTFQARFGGDAKFAGCSKVVKAFAR